MQEDLSFLEKMTYKITTWNWQAQHQNIRLRKDQFVVVSF